MDPALSSPSFSSLSFETLLPGLYKPGVQRAPSPDPAPTPALSSPSTSTSTASTGAPSLPLDATPSGMAKKRNGQRNSKHAKEKGTASKAGQAITQTHSAVATRSSVVAGPPSDLAARALHAREDGVVLGPPHHGDHLSTARPYVVPRAPKTVHRELPRVELEKSRELSPIYSSSTPSDDEAEYYSPASYRAAHPADRADAVFAVDEDQLSSSSAFSDSPSFVYTSDEFDDDDDGGDDGEYDSGDEGGDEGGDGGKKLDESDERRPFPDPRHANQHKYVRRTDSDGKTEHEETVDDTARSYVDPSAPSLPQSPVSPSHLDPSSAAAPSYVPYLATPAMSAYPSASHATVHYAPVSGATYDDAAYASDDAPFDPLDGPYPRGRSKYPRLLWRSELDEEALAVLDAHHERLRGGPLPRLALDGTRLSASGVEREREHAGLEEDEVLERVRRARRRDRGAEGRRTWSQAGRQWSREMERLGL